MGAASCFEEKGLLPATAMQENIHYGHSAWERWKELSSARKLPNLPRMEVRRWLQGESP